MAVLPTGFGKSLPFGLSITNTNNEWQNDRMQSTSWLIALMQDKVEEMFKMPDMKTAYASH
jgi:superfamily II DNA helicase RecQ